MSDAAKEVVCGSVAGGLGKIIEYPFDTVKVRLQTQNFNAKQFNGAWDCLSTTVKNEGFKGLYRGLSLPMAGAAAETAVLFVAYRQFSELLAPHIQHNVFAPLIAGSGAGVVASLILTPIELVKCKMQVAGVANSKHISVLKNLAEVIATQGFRGLWKGQLGTAVREAGGSAAWFATYELVLQTLVGGPDNTLEPNSSSQRVTLLQRMAAGAFAGVAYNFSLYPADTIKARMQTDIIMSRPALGFWGTFKSIVGAGGIRALYNGCGITCARAAPSSAIIFMVHGQLSEFWAAQFSL